MPGSIAITSRCASETDQPQPIAFDGPYRRIPEFCGLLVSVIKRRALLSETTAGCINDSVLWIGAGYTQENIRIY
jgi:hypothetical protein